MDFEERFNKLHRELWEFEEELARFAGEFSEAHSDAFGYIEMMATPLHELLDGVYDAHYGDDL